MEFFIKAGGTPRQGDNPLEITNDTSAKLAWDRTLKFLKNVLV